MGITTMGVKLDEATYNRIKLAVKKTEKTQNWLVEQAILHYLSQLEAENTIPEIFSQHNDPIKIDGILLEKSQEAVRPFKDFKKYVLTYSVIRSAITDSWRLSEMHAIPVLLEQARCSKSISKKIYKLAYSLAKTLRYQKKISTRTHIVQSLLQEFSLCSQEGVALMSLAEALLRIPDQATRDLLIRDKISKGNWKLHFGHSNSMYVNAATWGLDFTNRLINSHNRNNLSSALHRILTKSSEPLIRKTMDMAVRLMGKQFVSGENINEALANAYKLEKIGFRYSYDMLGEAALTSEDAQAYLLSYQKAIHAIGKASNRRGIYEGPGISIKLSALHPRYCRAQYERVIEELYPTLKALTLLAYSYDIGISIDAEEADRLELSLDLLEKLCFEPELDNWNGIGFVIQAYQKRCPFVIDALIDLAERSHRRLMIRLVKGAYWDSEIKRAQVDGMEGYPVYTRKSYTDISYLACARKLLLKPNLIYPQFATHNTQTLAAIYYLAGNNYYPGQYEFQCLYGMGETLYKQVVGKVSNGKLNRPCRIYAPVGSYKTLLAYLVRRLMENGANTSFVNRLANTSLPINELVTNPVSIVEKIGISEGVIGLPHPQIPLPRNLYGDRRINSVGFDMVNEHRLTELSNTLLDSAYQEWFAQPIIKSNTSYQGVSRPVINPSQPIDIVGNVCCATEDEVSHALDIAVHMAPIWSSVLPKERADILERAAKTIEGQIQQLISLLIREAGKTYNNAIAEIRETIDFLYYYASIVREHFDNQTHRPLGTIVCISPWNFPLAIFIGQIAAALAAGNSVLAKPAEQTPLIAAQSVQILLDSGIPTGVLQLLPGSGETVGAQLINDHRVCGVIFTGSSKVANFLQHRLADRLDPKGNTIPLIAETGGINAMIVDSSALTEQAVSDIMISAFDSAGQRCSALRLLCVQEDIADHTLKMLRGTMTEYRMGNPERLSTDIGPLIDIEAKINIKRHIRAMRNKGFAVYQAIQEHPQDLNDWKRGHFIKPTLIEINTVSDLDKEIFGPVLHVLRFSRKNLPQLIAQINASGYGLTLGLHTRIDETIEQINSTAKVGNLYVNRNMVGAVVGVQPFGGQGRSGTGPKAGGPLYLYRLLSSYPADALQSVLDRPDTEYTTDITLRTELLKPHQILLQWAKEKDKPSLLSLCQYYQDLTQTGTVRLFLGPTGESNTFSLLPRDYVLCIADNEEDTLVQLAAVTSLGSKVLWQDDELHRTLRYSLPATLQQRIELTKNVLSREFNAVIYHGDVEPLHNLCKQIASREGAIISVQSFSRGETNLLLERLLVERSLSVNTAATGGNTNLMTVG
ncbi:PutA protein [Candidatus Pantoea carbekii]|uniref:Bifunctional protein PutA n=1 Tax=Candidatus Pantoea carbekii TaxID=1235990 RepID=U3U321_9GAMM|nr:PutA protein [Candidatus Pantoea carbekii]